MHSSGMHTARFSGRLSCMLASHHAHPICHSHPAFMHGPYHTDPCHTYPLQCMPPPPCMPLLLCMSLLLLCHTCPLPHTSPCHVHPTAMHAPCQAYPPPHINPLPHTPPRQACPTVNRQTPVQTLPFRKYCCRRLQLF